MKLNISTALMTVLAASALAVACGDDEGSNGNGTGNGNGGLDCSQETTGEGGACDNASDLALINEPFTTQSGEACIADVTSACGLECASEPPAEQPTCVAACLDRDADAVSAECQATYVAATLCAAANCLAQCGTAPASMECATCRCENNCVQDFEMDSGIMSATTCM